MGYRIMEKIKIMLVDDEKLIREGLKIILSTYADLDVLSECSNGREAFEFCKASKVDVVLMDVRMPDCDGVLGTKLIKDICPDTKILMLTTFNDSEYIEQALSAGASGYLLKNSSYDLICAAIKAVHEGNVVVHPNILGQLMVKGQRTNSKLQEVKENTGLTDKEINIIEEIARGLSNKEIGDKLFLTEGTVKNNITTILSKLSLRDRTQIAIFAFKNNIVH